MVRDYMTDDPIVYPIRGFPTASDTIAPLDHRTRLPPDCVQPHTIREHSRKDRRLKLIGGSR
jgi:hypothetical protein